MRDSLVELTPVARLNRLPAVLEAALLPWEDDAELASFHAEFVAEHRPQGPTERHLLEQLVLLAWRKRRVAMADRALHMQAVHSETDAYSATRLVSCALVGRDAAPGELSLQAALRSDPRQDADELVDLKAAEEMTTRALAVLERGGQGAYQRALGALHSTTRQWWDECLEPAEGDQDQGDEDDAWEPTAESLQHFIEKVLEAQQVEQAQIAANPMIRTQAHGQSLDPIRAGKLQTYDIRLDRQFERTLGMLLQLQTARGTIPARQGRECNTVEMLEGKKVLRARS